MQTTQHSNTRCPVYLHPAAATSPDAVERIQQSTGLLVIINQGRATVAKQPPPVVTDYQGPWGGDAA